MCLRRSPPSASRVLFNPFDVVEDATVSLDELSSELRLVFKRLLKRDLATRQRGLSELRTWLSQCPDESKFAIIKVYAQCATDPERQIREQAQLCLLTIVRKNKKWLACSAKELLFFWIGSLSDPVAGVAATAHSAFHACFGKERVSEVCTAAARIVFAETKRTILGEHQTLIQSVPDEEKRLARSLQASHALHAACFVLQNLPDDSHYDYFTSCSSTIFKSKELLESLPTLDTLFRTALYRFMHASLQRHLIHPSQLDAYLGRIILDLSTLVAPAALDLLAIIPLDSMRVGQVCEQLQSALPAEIPKPALSKLFLLCESLQNSAEGEAENVAKFCKTIWSAIEKFKSLDTTRLHAIWLSHMACLKAISSRHPTLYRAMLDDCLCKAMHSASIPKAILADLLTALFVLDEVQFKESLLASLAPSSLLSAESKSCLLRSLPIGCDMREMVQLATNVISALDKNSQMEIIDSMSKSEQLSFSWLQIVLSNFIIGLFAAGQVEPLNCLRLIELLNNVNPSLAEATCQETSRLFKSLPPQNLLDWLGCYYCWFYSGENKGSSSPPLPTLNIMAGPELSVLASQNATIGNYAVLLKMIETEIRIGSQLSLLDCVSKILHQLLLDEKSFLLVEPLFPTCKVLLDSQSTTAISAFLASNFILLGLSLDPFECERDAAGFVAGFDVLSYPCRSVLIKKLLHARPDLWLIVLEHELADHVQVLEKMSLHITGSIAVFLRPLLASKKSTRNTLWNGESILLNIVIVALAAGIRCGDLERSLNPALTVAAFCLACRAENAYRVENDLGRFSLNTELECLLEKLRLLFDPKETVQALLHQENLPNTHMTVLINFVQEKSGFAWLLLREITGCTLVSAESLLASKAALPEFVMCETGSDALTLPEEIDAEASLRVMATGKEFGRDAVYQILAATRIDFDHPAHVFVLCRFLARALSDRSINAEYWSNHHAMISQVIYRIFDLFALQEQLLQETVTITWSLKLANYALDHATTSSIVLGCAGQFWLALKQLSVQVIVPALQPLLQSLCRLVVKLGKTVAASVDGDEIVNLMFKTTALPVKFACRALVMRILDVVLESNKFQMQKATRKTVKEEEAFQRERDGILIPWPALSTALLSNEHNDIEGLLALDIFLSLAEGSSEVAILSEAYATLFKGQLANLYLQRLASILGWLQGESFDLQKVEFVVFEYSDDFENVRYASHLIYRCLKTFPSVVRWWHSSLNAANSVFFERATKRFMSPLLIERELQRVRRATLDKIELKVEQTSTTCAIAVRYRFEDFLISLSLAVPAEYPLRAVTVTGGERLGISESKWRAWMLTVQTLLSHNLTIINVISQWKINADRTLEGIEPCSICYCVMHPGDRSLPVPSCRTCRQKFHSACLYRWFKVGGQATCPLCRALF